MTRPLRIGIACYPTFGGGSGVIATELGTALARRGHHAHFLCYAVPERLDVGAPNVFFHEVPEIDYPLLHHSSYTLTLASKMVELSRRESLDLLHVHYAIPHGASAYLARQSLGASAPRLVTTLHGTDITLVGADPSFLPITRLSILASDGVTVPSRYLAEATHALLDVPVEKPIEVIPNFVDTDAYRPRTPRRAGALAALFPAAILAERPVVLAHNSNFRPLKRADDVVRVLAAVARRRPALAVLIGDGPERAKVEALAHELGVAASVRFLGEQRHFAAVLGECDLFLLPSESESFGLAALEALALGVPVIAARVGGLPEVVVEGRTGILVDPRDVEAMAAAVLGLVGEEGRREELARAARQDVERRFARDAIVDRYEAYLASVLAR